MPESVRNVLTPFITSRYVLGDPAPLPPSNLPIYHHQMSHATWLRQFTSDLMSKCDGTNIKTVFSYCGRIIRRQDLAIPSFLLQYAVLNLLLDGSSQQKNEIINEFLSILSSPLPEHDTAARETLIMCSNVCEPPPFSPRCVTARLMRTECLPDHRSLLQVAAREKEGDVSHKDSKRRRAARYG